MIGSSEISKRRMGKVKITMSRKKRSSQKLFIEDSDALSEHFVQLVQNRTVGASSLMQNAVQNMTPIHLQSPS
jgi:hypothetical protein